MTKLSEKMTAARLELSEKLPYRRLFHAMARLTR